MPNTTDTQRLAHTVQIEGILTCLRPNTMSSGGTSGRASSMAGPGLEPGASGVRRPRARPLGNLTTVGHLAKACPDLSPHFHRFLTSFSTTEKAVF